MFEPTQGLIKGIRDTSEDDLCARRKFVKDNK